MESIGDGAFSGCKNLQSIELPENLESIGSCAFESTGLKSIELPDGIQKIGSNLLNGSADLLEVIIPNGVQSIPTGMFSGCISLKIIEIPETVVSIGGSAFYNCDELEKIIIPNSVTSIGEKIFFDCDTLKNVKLGNGISVIPISAFEHCDLLENIVLPYGITTISENAFKNDVAFTSITIPRATTVIATSAFSYPSNMTIYGVAGTYAETYANEQKITFVNQEVNATEISINSNNITLNKGEKTTITLDVIPSNFTDEVIWKSSDTSVATIENTGAVTAVSAGTATIKIIVGNVSTSCKVRVVQPVTSISLNKTSLNMEALESYQLTATVRPTGAENKRVTWTSSDPFVATVDEKGLVTALAKGTTTVTVASTDGSNIKKTCAVTVVNTAYICKAIDEIESSHDYMNNCSDYWIYQKEGAKTLVVTFDERTNIEDGFDYLYIYDSEENQIGKFTGSELAGKTIQLSGDTIKIKLVSDSAGTEWGFKIVSVEELCAHTSTEVKNQKDTTCTEDGYTGDTVCVDCGEKIKVGIVEKATGHSYKDTIKKPTCTEEGYTVHICSKCGESYTDTHTSATGHSYTTVIDKATATKNGSIVTKCSGCDEAKSTETIYYPKTITLSKTSYTYNGKTQKPSATVKDSKGNTLTKDTDYTVTYASGCKNVGTYKVTIKLNGNYTGTITKTFKINPTTTNISKLTAKSKGFTAKWTEKTTQVTGYQLQYSTSSKFSETKTVTVNKNSTTSKTISKLTKNKKYCNYSEPPLFKDEIRMT